MLYNSRIFTNFKAESHEFSIYDTNLQSTETGSRLISMLDIKAKSHFVQKLLLEYRQTHTPPSDLPGPLKWSAVMTTTYASGRLVK